MNKEYLSLADLEAFDSRSPNRSKERRFACPLCGQNKPIDAAHRSLAVNTENGSFICHRCQSKGRLREFWETRPIMPKKKKTKLKLMSHFSLRDVAEDKNESDQPKKESLVEKMAKYKKDFLHSPAEIYLLNRGISAEIADNAGCGFAEKWEHWEKKEEKWVLLGTDQRVVFPIFDLLGNLIAIHGRAINEDHQASSKITRGDKSQGLFLSDAKVLERQVIAICEGAIDAMALKSCGISAVAMTGTTPPDWFYRKLAFKNVLIATDADDAGDKSAYTLKLELQLRGAKTFRLRPKGAKDWGEVLEKIGESSIRKYLSVFAENSSDESRFEEISTLFGSGRIEAAEFAAGLIANPNLRENLLYQIRFNYQNAA